MKSRSGRLDGHRRGEGGSPACIHVDRPAHRFVEISGVWPKVHWFLVPLASVVLQLKQALGGLLRMPLDAFDVLAARFQRFQLRGVAALAEFFFAGHWVLGGRGEGAEVTGRRDPSKCSARLPPMSRFSEGSQGLMEPEPEFRHPRSHPTLWNVRVFCCVRGWGGQGLGHERGPGRRAGLERGVCVCVCARVCVCVTGMCVCVSVFS
jgi:hypothetical protein